MAVKTALCAGTEQGWALDPMLHGKSCVHADCSCWDIDKIIDKGCRRFESIPFNITINRNKVQTSFIYFLLVLIAPQLDK